MDMQAAYSKGAVIDGALLAWALLTVASVLYVAWDALRNTPEMPVMKWGWMLVTLYTGPVGAAVYVLSCKEPRRGTHEEFVRPLWKQSLGSTIHCLAGDATGVIVAATVTLALGLPMWLDSVVEYVVGFAFGPFVFQALFMRDMLGGSYAAALKRSFMPEWLSMNAVMGGMVPVMVVLMSRDMRSMEPTSLRYWGVMSLATLVGFVVAYPVNVWLVAAGLKHGMGTVRVLARGGHGLDVERARIEAVAAETPAGLPESSSARGASGAHGSHSGAGGSIGAVPPKVTGAQLGAVTLLTLLQLGAGVLIAAVGGDLGMSAAMRHGAVRERLPAPFTARTVRTCERPRNGVASRISQQRSFPCLVPSLAVAR